MQKKVLLKSCQENLERDYTNWEKKKKRDKENIINILPLQSRSPERGSPFPSPIYSSSSSQRSFPLSKFEKAFEAIRKMKEIVKKFWGNISLESPEDR